MSYVPFQAASGRTIIVGAHFDHISEGVGTLSTTGAAHLCYRPYEAIKVVRANIRLFLSDSVTKKQGLVGSSFYVHQMSKVDIASTDAMVNTDF